MRIGEKMLAELEAEFPATRKFLELVPDDRLTWKPHEKSMELGRLAWHLADFPGWVSMTVAQDGITINPDDVPNIMNAWKGKTRTDILAKFDGALPAAREVLSKVSDDDLARHWKMEWAGAVVMDSPKEQVMRRMVINHMIHHRAQFGVYLRLLEIPIPGVYGQSADELGI